MEALLKQVEADLAASEAACSEMAAGDRAAYNRIVGKLQNPLSNTNF
jgi:hypothetical protein